MCAFDEDNWWGGGGFLLLFPLPIDWVHILCAGDDSFDVLRAYSVVLIWWSVVDGSCEAVEAKIIIDW